MSRRLYVKINSNGSWANLVSCTSDRLEELKGACEVLADLNGSRVGFKVLESGGAVVAEFVRFPWPGQPQRWIVPGSPLTDFPTQP